MPAKSDEIDMRYAMWLLDMAIPNGECLECHYADDGHGYVKTRAVGKVHRFIYSILRNPIPDGLWVLHECDNRKCLHPNNLFEDDCAALETYYGRGWSEQVRQVVRAHRHGITGYHKLRKTLGDLE